MKFQQRPCGSCTSRPKHLKTEVFTDSASAFRRHAELVAVGLSPSFCRGRDGHSNVCHLAKDGSPA